MIACELLRKDFEKTGKYRNWRRHPETQDLEIQSETALDVMELLDSRLPKVINRVKAVLDNKTSYNNNGIFQKLLAQLSLSPSPWRKQNTDRKMDTSDCGNYYSCQRVVIATDCKTLRVIRNRRAGVSLELPRVPSPLLLIPALVRHEVRQYHSVMGLHQIY